ncbi:hypothetical protein GCM10010294_25470 [Streptomyces griseoloalbus]|uniref:hypothetical protein n=1 Tax=Streptomyces griseoloalbus TaxID=67303 RepID=UPI0018746C04|nr:hypothetical protein GCM10010294_25470 [Streptomyces griseoloalbus]
MCIRVQYAPRCEINDPWDAARNLILIPANLGATVLFTLHAIRAVLHAMDVQQPDFGARCWCGESIALPAPSQQRQNEVMDLGA